MAAPTSVDNTREQGADPGVCGVCLQSHTDPRLLPCLHTFCLQCIDQVRVTAKDGRISCPICRSLCPLPESGAEGLPEDLTVAEFRNVSTMSCLLCNEDEGDTTDRPRQRPSWWCKRCDGAQLCDAHLMPHLSATRSEDHVIASLDPRLGTSEVEIHSAVKGLDRRLPVCEQHDEARRLYCVPCGASICADCALFGDHQGHAPLRRVRDVVDERKMKVSADVDSLRTHSLGRLERSLQRVNRVCAELEQRTAHARVDIEAAGKLAVETVRRQVNLLLQQVDDMRDSRLKVLDLQRDELKIHLDAVSNSVLFSQKILQQTGGEELLPLLQALDARVSALALTEIDEEPQQHSLILFKPATAPVVSRSAEENLGQVICCRASAKNSRLVGERSKVVLSGSCVSFSIQLRDVENEAINVGGDAVTTRWVQSSEGNSTAYNALPDVTVEDHSNGFYSVLCGAGGPEGTYKLEVMVNSEGLSEYLSVVYYDFLWDAAGSHQSVMVGKEGRLVTLLQGANFDRDFCSVIGSPAMSQGEHRWKLKLGDSECQAGVATKPLSVSRLNDCFTVTYNWYGRKGGANRRDGVEWDRSRPLWSANDMIELLLNCEQHTLQLTNLNTGVSSTLTNLPDKEYFPFVSLRLQGDFAELVS